MQDIYFEEPELPKNRYTKNPQPKPINGILDYLIENHAKLYGEDKRTYFPKENRDSIAKFVAGTKLPYQHFVAYIFREMPDTKIFTNMITSKNWVPRFQNYLENLNLPVEVYQLKSPLTLPCWAEYQTFLSCMQSYVKDGSPIQTLIKNFVFSQRISSATLNYVYTDLDLNDAYLDQYFENYRKEIIYPYEDISPDLNYILQHYND
jgi:hypothetical protein